MQTVAIAFAVLIAVSVAMPTDLFEMFERKYNKKYATEEERSHRLHVFTETLKRIEQLNKDEPMRPHGINEFADLTQDEFRARFLMNAEQFASTRVSLADAPMIDLSAQSFDLPSEFDWRNNGSVITPVKNQEQCGSCWAFSTTENIESVWAIAGNGLLQLAPQQIVDCDTTDDGCNGGNPPTAYEYVIKAGGLELESVS
jgi:cathepsin F